MKKIINCKLINKHSTGIFFKKYWWTVEPYGDLCGLILPKRYAVQIPNYQYELYNIGENFTISFFLKPNGKYSPYEHNI